MNISFFVPIIYAQHCTFNDTLLQTRFIKSDLNIKLIINYCIISHVHNANKVSVFLSLSDLLTYVSEAKTVSLFVHKYACIKHAVCI